MNRLLFLSTVTLVAVLLLSCVNPQGASSDGNSGDTPEEPDTDSPTEQLSPPELEPPPATYESDTEVRLTPAEPSHSIYYTTDGSVPDTDAIAYSGPLSLSGDGATLQVSAVAVDRDGRSSDTVAGTYTVRYRYDLSVTSDPGGSVSVDPAGGSILSGETAELSAEPDAGYSFSGWEPSEHGTQNPLDIAVDSDLTIHAAFEALTTESLLRGGISVHEILPDPTGSPGYDTDGNGSPEADDEFVELVNGGETSISIAGLELWDPGAGKWFTFPADSVLGPGAAAVVVTRVKEGGTLPAGSAFSAEQGSVLNNSGDIVVLYDPDADEYLSVGYSGATQLDPASQWDSFSQSAVQVGGFEVWPTAPDGESLTRPSALAVSETVAPHGSLFAGAASPGQVP